MTCHIPSDPLTHGPRYTKLTMPHHASTPTADTPSAGLAVMPFLAVAVANLDEAPPQLETDEGYALTIPADGSHATLKANTVYGQ